MAFAPVADTQVALTTTLTTVLDTVTTGKTWVITDITICNTGSSTRKVTIAGPGSGAAHQMFSALAIAAGETVQWTGHKVLTSTQTITGGQDVGTDVTVTISKAEG